MKPGVLLITIISLLHALPAAAVNLVAAGSLGHSAILTFPGAEITQATTTATFCSAQGLRPRVAKLWMPSMGHGSAPTRISARDERCFLISDIDFLMPGDWQVKVETTTGERFVFSFDVDG